MPAPWLNSFRQVKFGLRGVHHSLQTRVPPRGTYRCWMTKGSFRRPWGLRPLYNPPTPKWAASLPEPPGRAGRWVALVHFSLSPHHINKQAKAQPLKNKTSRPPVPSNCQVHCTQPLGLVLEMQQSHQRLGSPFTLQSPVRSESEQGDSSGFPPRVPSCRGARAMGFRFRTDNQAAGKHK